MWYPGFNFVVIQLLNSVKTPWTLALQASLFFTISWSLLRFTTIKLVMPSNRLILWALFSFAFNLSKHQGLFQWADLHIRWPKYWTFSFSNSPSNEYSGFISFRIGRFDPLAVQGTLKSLLQHPIQKHQFFSTQPSLWSNSHIHTWLLEKPQLWLDGPLLAKWCFYF